MAHPRLQIVRERYDNCCGYCGVSETDVGGELTVDHFRPLSGGGDDRDANLVYACIRCNQYKGILHPELKGTTGEQRLLHPTQDDIPAHLFEDETTGRLVGLTATGTFHIEALRLNRPPLIANRQRRQLLELLEARLQVTIAEIAALRERLARRDLYIAYLEERLRDSSEA